MSIIIVNKNSGYDAAAAELSERLNEEVILITEREKLVKEVLDNISPRLIFFPHWSFIIPENIFSNYECVVFHMTDLPYGRGGSPLQNLIARGIKETKISALRAVEELDAGPVYLKEPLDLSGTAAEIFERCIPIVQAMMLKIATQHITPVAQSGAPIVFSRRKPEESNMAFLTEPEKIYDHIRMLDAPGYPPAFIEAENIRLEFTNASLQPDKTITANVRIIQK